MLQLGSLQLYEMLRVFEKQISLIFECLNPAKVNVLHTSSEFLSTVCKQLVFQIEFSPGACPNDKFVEIYIILRNSISETRVN